MPIVSLIKTKECKPDIFRFKKVHAKDENAEVKTDRACFTKGLTLIDFLFFFILGFNFFIFLIKTTKKEH
jgi:hypothetical protein